MNIHLSQSFEIQDLCLSKADIGGSRNPRGHSTTAGVEPAEPPSCHYDQI